MKALATEVVLAELGASQWGLFTAPQAQHAGVSRVRLSRLTKAGALVRLAHGIYALRGAMSSDRLELRAAWLGLDPARLASDRLGDGPAGAVVSHASAADLYGFGDLDADRHEFTTPSRKQTRRPDVRLHRGVLTAGDVTLHGGLPVTTPERVVVDLLAAGHDGEHVAGVLASAVRDRRIGLARLAPRLEPFAARLGFPPRDGQSLLDHLLELGGVSDLIVAEQLVDVARASNRTVASQLRSDMGDRAADTAVGVEDDVAGGVVDQPGR
jgi:Transcriptional regulator, AbiEi antitoxin/AbiEi antitoxin C-terminal domain